MPVIGQKEANSILLFIQCVFGLQDHILYFLDCLFLVMNVIFTSTVNVPRPPSCMKVLWKSDVMNQGFQTHSFRVVMTAPSLTLQCHQSLHPVESTFKIYSEFHCFFITYVLAQATGISCLDYCRDLKLLSLLSPMPVPF